MGMFDRLFGKSNKKRGADTLSNKNDTYHSEEYCFSVQCPNGWITHTQDMAPHVLVIFYNSSNCENNISISVSKLWMDHSIKDLKALHLYELIDASRYGMKIIPLKNTKVNDIEAVERVYKLHGRKYKEIIFIQSTYEYVFACGAKINKFKDCEPIFDECLRSFKFERVTEAETCYVSGVSYDLNESYREAEEKYLEVIRLNPKFHKAYCNLGRIYQLYDRLEEAVEY